jgi:hypothetical protein
MHTMFPLMSLEVSRSRTDQIRREADTTRYDRRRRSRSRRDRGKAGSPLTWE